MHWLNNRKIATKLFLSFAIVAALAGVIGVVGIREMRTLSATAVRLHDEGALPLVSLGHLAELVQRMRAHTATAFLAAVPEDIAQRQERMDQLISAITDMSEAYHKTLRTEDMQQAFATFQTAHQALLSLSKQYLALLKAGKIRRRSSSMNWSRE
jgi:methyl-accepting chemotaxis protein